MRPLSELVRDNILRLAPYSSARDEYSGHEARVFLDANENPYNQPYNRYPDPLQRELKAMIARRKGVAAESIFLGNGSDEAIDLVFRVFCRPGRDNVVAISPTYGMYEVCARINDVEYRPVLLDGDFQTDACRLLAATDSRTKAVWLCSPNNPTGNHLREEAIEGVLRGFGGIVVVDEAYADFSPRRSLRHRLAEFPNLIVLNTMSKAWGCAAIRLGMAFASPEIVALMNKVKYPYNVNQLTQQEALRLMSDPYAVDRWVKMLLEERARLIPAFAALPLCRKIYPTDANFFLARVADADAVYRYLVEQGIIVRNRSRVSLCEQCLRVTVGTKGENSQLLAALRKYSR